MRNLNFLSYTIRESRQMQEYMVLALGMRPCDQAKLFRAYDLTTCHSEQSIQHLVNLIGMSPFYIKLGTLAFNSGYLISSKFFPKSKTTRVLRDLRNINSCCYICLVGTSHLKKLITILKLPNLTEIAKRPFTQIPQGLPSGHFASVLPLIIASQRSTGLQRYIAMIIASLIPLHRMLTGAHTPVQLVLTALPLLTPVVDMLYDFRNTEKIKILSFLATTTDILFHPGISIFALPAIATLITDISDEQNEWGISSFDIIELFLLTLSMICPAEMAMTITFIILATVLPRKISIAGQHLLRSGHSYRNEDIDQSSVSSAYLLLSN